MCGSIGGCDTQIWAHGLTDDPNGNPDLNPLDVTIGAHVYVGARSTLVGCAVPDRTVVGAGSVVTKKIVAEATPYDRRQPRHHQKTLPAQSHCTCRSQRLIAPV